MGMTTPQMLAFGLLAATIALFVWDRLRYDVVAMLALCAGMVMGLVPFDHAFRGFSDPVVVVVAAALVVSAAIERSGVVERLVRPLAAVRSPTVLVGTLVAMVAVLSAFMKNVGALAIFIPVTLRLARQVGLTPSQVLMPLSFASLIGGLMTLIGTSPNIIVSRVRADLTGVPFSMFDFTLVGAGITACGVAFIAFGWRILPRERTAQTGQGADFHIQDYLSELKVPEGSALVDCTVRDVEQLFSGGLLTVATVIRDKGHRYVPGQDWVLSAGDVLVLEGDPAALLPMTESGMLEPMANGGAVAAEPVEVVVMPNSPLVGSTAARSMLRRRFGVALLAVRRSGRDYVNRLRQIEFQAGDVLVVEVGEGAATQTLEDLGLLPLAQRRLGFGGRKGRIPIVVVAATMALVAFGVVPVGPAFFMAALVLVLTGCLSLKDAYDAIQWPIILLLGALIPVSEAMKSTGASELMAGWLATAASQLPPLGAIAMVMAASMLLAPFLHHAATVLLMGPVAASMATRLGLAIDPFLMAVAIGAASDFLTPIGHQCNTLVMGPGGYRFGDYWRLGLPLSLIVLTAGTLLLPVAWPLR
ncbi:MAG TPA: SLC13 family permease [Magnetospirillum sp.]|jgi:di/tricarboxylate transporter|nr:SLC13 family permease [Magnetospirillum sp.]